MAQATYPQAGARPARPERSVYTSGPGWILFSTLMLGFAGVFNIVDGIIALGKSKFYVDGAVYVFSDLRTWGWITLILGVVLLIAAYSVAVAGSFGRWFGIGAASVNAIGQLLFLPGYPLWALAIFAIDVLIIYGLAMYGGESEARGAV